jgi:putative oxidoreductase
MGPIPERWAPYLLSVLRIIVAFLYLAHGTQKLIGYPSTTGTPVPLMSLLGLASVIETVGGILMLLGLFTRPVGFILAGEMAVAYFKSHAPQGFWPLLNRGQRPGPAGSGLAGAPAASRAHASRDQYASRHRGPLNGLKSNPRSEPATPNTA